MAVKSDILPFPPVTEDKRRNAASVSFLVLTVILAVLILPACSVFDHSPGSNKSISFESYDTPLYAQVTDRIKKKIHLRLGEGENNRDRYFIIPFAYQNKQNAPEVSHSFMTFIRVLADDQQPRLDKGFKTGNYKNRQFEAFTISWLPADFLENPNLCVFSGFGSRISPEKNLCPTLPGENTNLEDTIKLAVNFGNAVCMWGPYEISKEGFQEGIRRKNLLDGGTIRYRADDRITRKDQSAINCFHAMAGVKNPYPDGGIFGTGFMVWGINGTARVLNEYSENADLRNLLLEPVDARKDRFGFVYVPGLDARKPYNPFANASAYRK